MPAMHIRVPLLFATLAVVLAAQSTTTDGSKTPQLIPDVTAFRLVFGSLGAPVVAASPTAMASSATFSPTPKQSAVLAKTLGLSAADTNAVLGAVQSWRSAIPASSTVDLDGITAPYVTRLQKAMTAAGWTVLYNYIEGEKSHMKIVTLPGTMMK
jgi:hypothetical protein